jgi:hypothetical protein
MLIRASRLIQVLHEDGETEDALRDALLQLWKQEDRLIPFRAFLERSPQRLLV